MYLFPPKEEMAINQAKQEKQYRYRNKYINPFHVTVPFLYLLKTLKNLWFSDVFRCYRKGPVA